jgi:glycosyltransferase involved in cell wall biosynthesis
MTVSVSIIIPNRNGGATIGKCLEAAFSSGYKDFEVIVVDDFSVDQSVEVIRRYPCKFLQLAKHSGASRARNVGADHSSGDILFFTDADCLLNEDALTIAVESLSSAGPNVVLGGTYTIRPVDQTFFSRFQSVFIN